MASLLQGFENDIFISYRQNDNKYDGWVTEFAANLNKELEATIKEAEYLFIKSGITGIYECNWIYLQFL
jgi:hypothetical protein